MGEREEEVDWWRHYSLFNTCSYYFYLLLLRIEVRKL